MFSPQRMLTDDIFLLGSSSPPPRTSAWGEDHARHDTTSPTASHRGKLGRRVAEPSTSCFHRLVTTSSTASISDALFMEYPHYDRSAPFNSEHGRRVDMSVRVPSAAGMYEARSVMTASDLYRRYPSRRNSRVLTRVAPYSRPQETQPWREPYYQYPNSSNDGHHIDHKFRLDNGFTSRLPPLPQTHYQNQGDFHYGGSDLIPLRYADQILDSRGDAARTQDCHRPHVEDDHAWHRQLSRLPSRRLSPAPTPIPEAREAPASPPPLCGSQLDDATATGQDLTLVGQLCAKRNCYRQACPLYGEFCEFHKPSRLCKVPECRKCAKTGGFCISHGGGRRCQRAGCSKSAKEGGLCIAHGGGKRCPIGACDKAATPSGLCASHQGEAEPGG